MEKFCLWLMQEYVIACAILSKYNPIIVSGKQHLKLLYNLIIFLEKIKFCSKNPIYCERRMLNSHFDSIL